MESGKGVDFKGASQQALRNELALSKHTMGAPGTAMVPNDAPEN